MAHARVDWASTAARPALSFQHRCGILTEARASCSGRTVSPCAAADRSNDAHSCRHATRWSPRVCWGGRESVMPPRAAVRSGMAVLEERFGRGGPLSQVPRLRTPPPPPRLNPAQPETSTTFVAETLLPTKHGEYRLRAYRHTTDGGRRVSEPVVMISGSPEGCSNVLVRVHDACFTSEVLGSQKCDCQAQLTRALEAIRSEPPGLVIYLQQEGRGIGLANKVAAYALQERGLDTVDANRALGLPDDCREYSAVGAILCDLGVVSVRLMTNNPRKLREIAAAGVHVLGRVPCVVRPSRHSLSYMEAKARRMAHLLEEGADQEGLWSSGDDASSGEEDGALEADEELQAT